MTWFNALGLELYKAKRRKTLLVILPMVAMQGLWLAWAMRNAGSAELALGYTACLYQFPLLNAIVLPVAIGVLCSRLCDMEHKGNTLKQLRTMQSAGLLFDAKFMIALFNVLIGVAAQIGLIFVLGQWYGFTDAFDPAQFAVYFFTQSLCSLFLVLLVQLFALKYVNQFIPLVVGLLSGFLGLMAMFFPPWVMRLVPSAYYGLLSTVGMSWDAATRVTTYYPNPFSLPDCLILTGAAIVVYLVGRRMFVKKEV